MSIIPPTLPFDVAQTYGVRAPLSVRPLPSAPQATSIEQTQPVGRIDRADQADLTRVSAGIGRLLGARVEQPAFEGLGPDAPASRPTPMAFYHHPADANAAATGVDLGRALDVSG